MKSLRNTLDLRFEATDSEISEMQTLKQSLNSKPQMLEESCASSSKYGSIDQRPKSGFSQKALTEVSWILELRYHISFSSKPKASTSLGITCVLHAHAKLVDFQTVMEMLLQNTGMLLVTSSSSSSSQQQHLQKFFPSFGNLLILVQKIFCFFQFLPISWFRGCFFQITVLIKKQLKNGIFQLCNILVLAVAFFLLKI